MKFLHDFYGEPSPALSVVRRPFLNGLFFTSAGFLTTYLIAKAAGAPSELLWLFQAAAIGVGAIWFCIVGAIKGFSGYYGHAERIVQPPDLNQTGALHIAWAMHRWIVLMYLLSAQFILALAFTIGTLGNGWVVIGVSLLSCASGALLFAKFARQHAQYRRAVIKACGSLREGVAALPIERQEFIAQCIVYRWVGNTEDAWMTAFVGSALENKIISDQEAKALSKATALTSNQADCVASRRL